MIRKINLSIYLKAYFLFLFIFFFGLVQAQNTAITVSGLLKDKKDKVPLSYANVILKAKKDSSFIVGTVCNEEGRYVLNQVKPGSYLLVCQLVGYTQKILPVYIGSLSPNIELSVVELETNETALNELVINGKQDEVNSKLDKKSFSIENNISNTGGSVLQAMQNLPGVSVQDGKVQLRGNDKVMVLIDGKQTALTGFGSQNSLDNIPASSIEKIEIINNPSAKYDANGNAGIINIVYKKTKKEGWSGKAGLTGGLGAIWVKKENLPGIRPQYQNTPKINPALSLNYTKKKISAFVQGDYLYTHTLNKNEFVTRTYENDTVIQQQTKRNRNTGFLNTSAGIDYALNSQDHFTVSGLFGREKILDNGDEPFYYGNSETPYRLWQFLEDEVKTTVAFNSAFQHQYKEPGRVLKIGFNYTFHREDEKYYFQNKYPSYTGLDSFKLISDERVGDLTIDYIKPLKYGRFETGMKFRRRVIPTNMNFIPGLNSPLDTNAGGWATYKETIPAVYGTYVYESAKLEAEIGLRVEFVDLNYEVNPNHNTYKSDGYTYFQPFPNLRLAYKLNESNKFTAFYNRRVDRPNELDIRIFPKYDDAEVIKVGNPALKPQFTNSFELAFKNSHDKGYFYASVFHKIVDGTITRISATDGVSTLIYAVSQNADRSYQTGTECLFSRKVNAWYSFNLNLVAYHKKIDAFEVTNKYPVSTTFVVAAQEINSGNAKWVSQFHFKNKIDLQVSAVYLAPDIIPQGKTNGRFTLDIGLKKSVQNGRGEWVLNATDLLNTMVVKKEIQGEGFHYTATDYYETQVIRLGYSYKF
jgi:hypothetical protein